VETIEIKLDSLGAIGLHFHADLECRASVLALREDLYLPTTHINDALADRQAAVLVI